MNERLPTTCLLILLCISRFTNGQTTLELTTADEGGADIGLYNDNQRGAFTNQDGSGGVDIRDLGPDDLTDDSEPTRKRAGLLQFDFSEVDNPSQITSVELEMIVLQGSTTALVDIYGVNDEDDSLGLAGDGEPGFDPTDPDFHFANSGLFHYYDHEDALLPDHVPPIPDDDDLVNADFYDSTLDLDLTKVELLTTQSEEGDGDADQVIGVFSDETSELLDFVRKDTNGKVLFLIMPTSGQAVTLNNGANGAAATLFLRLDDSATPGDFDNDGDLDNEDIALLVEQFDTNNAATFDLNNDQSVDVLDLNDWIRNIKQTWIGDANLDGEFNSTDFVLVFEAGKFETDQAANWSDGDWNGDGRFNSGDFVAAFQDGGFELGPRPMNEAVPEPTGHLSLLVLACFMILKMRSR